MFCFLLLLQQNHQRLLLHGHIRRILNCMGTQFFIKAGPDLERRAGDISLQRKSCQFSFTCLPFLLCSKLLYLPNFPKKNLVFYSNFLYERRLSLSFILLITEISGWNYFVVYSSAHRDQWMKLFCRLFFCSHSSVDEIIFAVYFSDHIGHWINLELLRSFQ